MVAAIIPTETPTEAPNASPCPSCRSQMERFERSCKRIEELHHPARLTAARNAARQIAGATRDADKVAAGLRDALQAHLALQRAQARWAQLASIADL